jgi:hypothetical protein
MNLEMMLELGSQHWSFLPNQLYLLWAMKWYIKSLKGFGTIRKTANRLIGNFNFTAIFSTAVLCVKIWFSFVLSTILFNDSVDI